VRSRIDTGTKQSLAGSAGPTRPYHRPISAPLDQVPLILNIDDQDHIASAAPARRPMRAQSSFVTATGSAAGQSTQAPTVYQSLMIECEVKFQELFSRVGLHQAPHRERAKVCFQLFGKEHIWWR